MLHVVLHVLLAGALDARLGDALAADLQSDLLERPDKIFRRSNRTRKVKSCNPPVATGQQASLDTAACTPAGVQAPGRE